MRPHHFALLLVSLAMPLQGIAARADIIGTFDENGNGRSVYTVTGMTSILTGVNGADLFDPSNGLKPLIYNLGIDGVTMVNGDIEVTDPGTSTASDLFRFYTDPATTQNLLIVYSEMSPGGAVADVGIPGSRQTNLLSLMEMGPVGGPNGIFGYTPTPSQPGYVDIQAGNFQGNLIYNLVGDSAVPEPSSIVLLGLGLAAAAGFSRARRRSTIGRR